MNDRQKSPSTNSKARQRVRAEAAGRCKANTGHEIEPERRERGLKTCAACSAANSRYRAAKPRKKAAPKPPREIDAMRVSELKKMARCAFDNRAIPESEIRKALARNRDPRYCSDTCRRSANMASYRARKRSAAAANLEGLAAAS